jgi:hypothetical protein
MTGTHWRRKLMALAHNQRLWVGGRLPGHTSEACDSRILVSV